MLSYPKTFSSSLHLSDHLVKIVIMFSLIFGSHVHDFLSIQNARRTNGRDSNGQSAAAGSNRGGPTFTSMPFSGSLPDDFGTIFMDVGPEGSDSNGSNEPGITLGGSVSFTVRAGETTTVELPIGQQMQDIMGAMRSVMDMFPSPPPGPQGDGQA